jgi:hypothetical protein
VLEVTDGINLLSRGRIGTGTVKIHLEEVGHPTREDLGADVDGAPLDDMDIFCVDPAPERYMISAKAPAGLAAGSHVLTVALRGRPLARVPIEIGG